MALYKGIAFPDDVAPLARHMGSLNDHREALTNLSGTWDTLALLAHLSNLKADMSEVRASFAQLTTELLVCLAEESLKRATESLGHQAQIAVDVLTRNLFERTADIGFLATDSVIVDACASGDAGELAALRQRLRVYADRYTVYRDIVLMAPDGRVLTRLVDGFDGRSSSPVVRRALEGTGGFVESWEPTDFCGGARALTYAWRVERDGRAIGVLALEFDLAREARMIFERLSTDDELLALVDASGHVVVSSDVARLPAGHQLALRAGAASLRLGGITYVATQGVGHPYQGYAGPGWSVVALSPVELAFGQDGVAAVDVTFSGETVFSPRLLDAGCAARSARRPRPHGVERPRPPVVRRERVLALAAGGDRRDGAQDQGRVRACVDRAADDRRREPARRGAVPRRPCGRHHGPQPLRARQRLPLVGRQPGARRKMVAWPSRCKTLASASTACSTVYADILLFDTTGRVVAASRDHGVEGSTLADPWVSQSAARLPATPTSAYAGWSAVYDACALERRRGHLRLCG